MLPNAMLRYRQLSYTARGLLADLLSRPAGWREDGQHMADTSPQGRGAIRKALKELTAAGFYRVEKIRMPDGRIVSEAHVYDSPQLPPPPGATRPASGEPTTGGADALSKNRYKEPSLPTDPVSGETAANEGTEEPGGREEDLPETEDAPALPDEQVREAVDALFRAIRPEPRLHLGEAEARALTPLIAQWPQRGATHADLARALLPGLPVPSTHRPAYSATASPARCHPPKPPCAQQRPGTPSAPSATTRCPVRVSAAPVRVSRHAQTHPTS